MGFRRIELGLSETPPAMDGLEESQRETGVVIPSLVVGCRDSLNGSMVTERLGSLSEEECERAMNSVRRHVRLARMWGCPTVVVRGAKMDDPKLRQEARAISLRIVRNGATAELKEEVGAFVLRAQRVCQPQIEQFCRSLFQLQQEAPDVVFGIEPGRDLDDLLSFDAVGWILDDLSEKLGYWHDVGRVHHLQRLGLPAQGRWLEAYAPRMLGVHLQDAADEETEMPLGLGEVDFRLIADYLPRTAERVLEISPRHGRAEILSSVQFLGALGL